MKARLVILSAVLVVVAAPLAAVEMLLSDEEKVKCTAEGGCGMVSYAWIKQQVEQAFEKGKKACNSST